MKLSQDKLKSYFSISGTSNKLVKNYESIKNTSIIDTYIKKNNENDLPSEVRKADRAFALYIHDRASDTI